jgi:glycosyltransferase involved in cell wall biosynthesis
MSNPTNPSNLSDKPLLVSVALSVYNNDRFLRMAVESILNQSFTDFEFLIVDDGSTDRSLPILQEYAARDQRIRLTSRANRGIPKTRNELLTQAQGEFIAVMDGDDLALADRLLHQVEFLQQHPEVVCVGGNYDFIDEAGRVLMHHQTATTDAEIQQLALTGNTPINHPSAMMRRSAMLQVGGYDETLSTSSDLDLFLKLGEIGQLANLPETVLGYRQHDRAISELKQLEQTANRRKACEQAWQRRGITGEFTATAAWRPFDRPSRHEFMLRYGWHFFNQGERFAAILYGWRSIQALPLAIDGWKLLACALIKPLPQPTLNP